MFGGPAASDGVSQAAFTAMCPALVQQQLSGACTSEVTQEPVESEESKAKREQNILSKLTLQSKLCKMLREVGWENINTKRSSRILLFHLSGLLVDWVMDFLRQIHTGWSSVLNPNLIEWRVADCQV